MAWRTFLGLSLVGMIGTLFFALVTLGNGSLNLMESFLPYIFSFYFPLICAATAAVVGPWLTRYFPFSQSLLFGGITVVVVTLVFAVISVWESIVSGPCDPGTLCSAPLDGMFWLIFVFGFPMFLNASIGYGVSVWSPTRRGRKVFWPLLIGVVVVFAASLVIANI